MMTPYSLCSLTMLRQMFSTAPCENPKRSNFWVLYSGHCLSRTHGGPASFFFLTCKFGFESKSFSSLCFASRKLRVCEALQIVYLEGLAFPLQFLFRLVPNRDSEQGLKPFQSILHLKRQRRSKCLYGRTAGSRFCGLVKNMQESKDARVTDPSVTKTFAPRSARLVALLSCDSSCAVAGCICLSGLNEIWMIRRSSVVCEGEKNIFCKQKVACLQGAFVNCVLGRLCISLATSLSLGSKSRLWARSQTISIHFTPKLPTSKQMFVWPHRRFSVLWAGEKHARIKRCKGDRSLCDEDICSTISTPCCAIELWQFMCCSRLYLFVGTQWNLDDSQEQRGVWGWEEHFLIWQWPSQKTCAKNQHLSPATHIVTAFLMFRSDINFGPASPFSCIVFRFDSKAFSSLVLQAESCVFARLCISPSHSQDVRATTFPIGCRVRDLQRFVIPQLHLFASILINCSWICHWQKLAITYITYSLGGWLHCKVVAASFLVQSRVVSRLKHRNWQRRPRGLQFGILVVKMLKMLGLVCASLYLPAGQFKHHL